MKIIIIILFLILSNSEGFCQVKTLPRLANADSVLIWKLATIDAYINEVNHHQNLSSVQVYDSPEFTPESIYRKTNYIIFDGASYKKLKMVAIAQNIDSIYYKDGRIIYAVEISSAHGNYSNTKTTYYQNDSILSTKNRVDEEHILQIQYTYNGAEQGHSFTLMLDKDSIKYSGDKKIEMKISLSDWNKLLDSFNLTEFDSVKTGGFLSYIDGHDFSYVITTDKRTHGFVNAQLNDPELRKLEEFFKQINLLNL